MSERELRFKARMMAKEKAPKNPIETPFRSTETLPPYSSPHKDTFERSPDALQNLEIGAIVQEGYFQTPGGSGLRIVQSMAHPIDAYDQGSTGLSPRSDEDGTIHGSQESLIKSGNSPIKESQRVKNGQKIVDFFQNDPASRHSSQSDLINHSETEDSLQYTMLPIIFGHLPAGTSTSSLVHYGQNMQTGDFRMFDHGPELNMKLYNCKVPPQYPIEKITAPSAFFHGENDWLADPTDVQKLSKRMPNLVMSYRVPLKDFNHMDFLFANDVVKLLYKKVLKQMQKYL